MCSDVYKNRGLDATFYSDAQGVQFTSQMYIMYHIIPNIIDFSLLNGLLNINECF